MEFTLIGTGRQSAVVVSPPVYVFPVALLIRRSYFAKFTLSNTTASPVSFSIRTNENNARLLGLVNPKQVLCSLLS